MGAQAVRREIIESLLGWANGRWSAEVEHRPDVNIHKRTLNTTWKQVINKLESELVAEPAGLPLHLHINNELTYCTCRDCTVWRDELGRGVARQFTLG